MSALLESALSSSLHSPLFLDLRQLSASSTKAHLFLMLMKFGSESSPSVPAPSQFTASGTLSFFRCYQSIGFPFLSSEKFPTGCASSIIYSAPKVTVVANLHRFERRYWFAQLFGE
jgi:hypothetical protein